MSKRLHIALICASLAGGGAQRILVNLAGEFARRGHRVDLVLANQSGAYVDHVAEEVRVVDLEASRMLTALPGLVGYLRREQPDTAMSTMGYVNVIATVAKYLSGASSSLVVRESGVPVKEPAGTKRTLTSQLVPMLKKQLYPLADNVVAISHGAKAALVDNIKVSKDAITVIHNPAYTPDIERKAQADISHPWLEEPFDEPVIVGMGRLASCKNFELSIEATASLLEHRSIRLIIFGKGEQKAKLKALARKLGIEERVDFPGFVANPFAYLKRADVFVCSSMQEGFGNVVVEALATGTPVVSTNCPGGPPEILEGGKWGPLVPVGDAEAMAEAIGRVLDDPLDAEALRERARSFSVERVADQYLDLLGPED